MGGRWGESECSSARLALGAALVVGWGGCWRESPSALSGGGGTGGAGMVALTTDAGADDAGAGPEASPAADAAASDAEQAEGGPPLCPAETPPDPIAPPPVPAAADLWSPPTPVPHSCAPMPRATFFARPAPAVVGAYARCASFEVPRVSALAISPDGRRAALVGGEGVVRVVDLASRQVVGLLAPPRASVRRVAFSPLGDAILTVANGEREVSLWRADTFQPLWTTSLPGQSYAYYSELSGVAAFSPDGKSALASPGVDLFLLDLGTGAIRATRLSAPDSVVLDAAYGRGGLQAVVADSPIQGHCSRGPHGGAITALDPGTLADGPVLMQWGGYGSADNAARAEMLVARDGDLVLTPGSAAAPGIQAFRLSDGSPLPAPALPTFPLALTADAGAALLYQDGQLTLIRPSDGGIIGQTAETVVGPVAMTGDGGTIAIGGASDRLLSVWHSPDLAPSVVCSVDQADTITTSVGTTGVSADGETLAMSWGPEIRVVRRADNARLATLSHDGGAVAVFRLSPDARYVLARFYSGDVKPTASPQPLLLFRVAGGGSALELAADGARFDWNSFRFGPDAEHLSGVRTWANGPSLVSELVTFDLSHPGNEAVRPVAASPSPSLRGFTAGCPLLVDLEAGARRSCDSCEGPHFAADPYSAVMSADGEYLASRDPQRITAGITLWKLLPSPQVVRSFPDRVDGLTELPAAIAAGGQRVIAGPAGATSPCFSGPGWPARVYQGAAELPIDRLPPYPTGSDAQLRVLSYGAELWCLR